MSPSNFKISKGDVAPPSNCVDEQLAEANLVSKSTTPPCILNFKNIKNPSPRDYARGAVALSSNFQKENLDEYQLQSLDKYWQLFSYKYFTETYNYNMKRHPDDLIDPFDSITSFIEDMGYLLMKVFEARKSKNSKTVLLEAIFVFVKLRTGKSVASLLHKATLYGSILKEALDTCSEFLSGFQMQNLDTFSNHLNQASDVFQAFAKLHGTAFFQKLKRLIYYILTLNICEDLKVTLTDNGFVDLENHAKASPIKNGAHFLVSLCDYILFLLRKGVQILRTGDLSCIFHSGETYGHLYDNYNTLKIQTTQLHNPELFGFHVSSYQALLAETIANFKNVQKHTVFGNRFDKEAITKVLLELQFWQTQFITKQAARLTRRAPFGILFCGESGIGKTYMKELMFNFYGQTMGLDTQSDFCFTRSPGANFWDGFKSHMWAIILDDIGFPNPNKCPNGDPTYNDLLQIMNNNPWGPDQARLEDKGNTPMMAKLVVATTNIKNLNAREYFAHPSAAQRRLPIIITPIVKPEYATDDAMLDRSKLPPSNPNHYDDYWTYRIETVVASKTTDSEKYATYFEVEKNCDMKTLFKYLHSEIMKHEASQDRFMKSVSDLKKIKNCPLCNLPKDQFCTCSTPHSVENLENFNMQSNNIGFCWFQFFWFILSGSYLYGIWKYLTFKSRINTAIAYLNPFSYIRAPPVPDRNYFISLGERAQERIVGLEFTKRAKVLISAVAAISTSYYVYRKFNPKDNMTMQSEGYTPQPGLTERVNPWFKESYQLSTFDLTSASTSMVPHDDDTFSKLIGRNCCSILVYPGYTPSKAGKAVCLKGNIYLTNNHLVPPLKDASTIKLTFSHDSEGVSTNFTTVLSESQLVRLPERDMVLIYLNHVPPKQGVYKYLPRSERNGDAPGYYVNRDENGFLETNLVRRATYLASIDYKHLSITPAAWRCDLTKDTYSGLCGAVLWVKTPIGKIVCGLHALGQDKRGIALAMAQDTFDIHLTRFGTYAMQGGSPELSSPSVERTVGPLHIKSPFRYIPEGVANVYGSYTGFRPQPKSRVSNSLMVHSLSKQGYRIKYGKPCMKGWEPWYIAASDMVKPVLNWDNHVLDIVTESFKSEIISQLGDSDYDMVHILDDDTTINGCDGVAYIDKMNRSTSAGAPYRKVKRSLMELVDPEGDPNGRVKFVPEVNERIATIISKYGKDERAMPVFTAHLKDEATSFAKVQNKKTRVFCGAPLDFSFVVRKYLLGTVRLIQHRRELFESAPGTIAQSREWDYLYHHITKFGADRIVAGDYSKFDKRMSSALTTRAFHILIEICKASGNYDDSDIKILNGICNDIVYPLVDFNGDLVMFHGTNPSGHPLTVIINGLVNSLMLRYAYYQLNPKKEACSFRDHVSLMTYGDDNIFSVSYMRDWFNHTSISELFKRYGIGYTMADKEKNSVPFISMNEATFLKRKWRYDKDVHAFLAPLDHDSIEKSLMVWVSSKTICPQAQAVAIISSAIREYFFYGKTIFEEKRNMFELLLAELDLVIFSDDSTLPTWERLAEDFDKNSEHLRHTIDTSDDDYLEMQSQDIQNIPKFEPISDFDLYKMCITNVLKVYSILLLVNLACHAWDMYLFLWIIICPIKLLFRRFYKY